MSCFGLGVQQRPVRLEYPRHGLADPFLFEFRAADPPNPLAIALHLQRHELPHQSQVALPERRAAGQAGAALCSTPRPRIEAASADKCVHVPRDQVRQLTSVFGQRKHFLLVFAEP